MPTTSTTEPPAAPPTWDRPEWLDPTTGQLVTPAPAPDRPPETELTAEAVRAASIIVGLGEPRPPRTFQDAVRDDLNIITGLAVLAGTCLAISVLIDLIWGS